MTLKSDPVSGITRRTVLKAAVGIRLEKQLGEKPADSKVAPNHIGPQENDQLVFMFGQQKGEIITPRDLPLGGPQVFAYPMDPTTKLVKDSSRLNQVILARLEPEEISERIRKKTVAGVVAYSAVCTHTGCDVSEWNSDTGNFICSCHYSEFDPRRSAQVMNGPAPRRLAQLPLKLEKGVLMAAGGFSGRVGPK